MTLSAFAAESRRLLQVPTVHLQLSLNISCPQGAQQQTDWLPLLLSIDGTERQTNTQQLHSPCSTCYTGSANNTHKYFASLLLSEVTRGQI